jgi:hypothetical protein
MQWSMGDVWTATVPLPQPSVCEYKYVLVGGDGKPVKWQAGNNNVLAIKPDQDSLDVHDQWCALPHPAPPHLHLTTFYSSHETS